MYGLWSSGLAQSVVEQVVTTFLSKLLPPALGLPFFAPSGQKSILNMDTIHIFTAEKTSNLTV